jgi:excisionase family DNA binding protein
MLRDKVELLTTAQVARRLKQSEEVIRRKARDGTLPALRLGYGPRAPLRFDEREFEAWLYLQEPPSAGGATSVGAARSPRTGLEGEA